MVKEPKVIIGQTWKFMATICAPTRQNGRGSAFAEKTRTPCQEQEDMSPFRRFERQGRSTSTRLRIHAQESRLGLFDDAEREVLGSVFLVLEQAK